MTTPVDMMTVDEWTTYMRRLLAEQPKGMRRGQWAFNLLNSLHPVIADRYCRTEMDPYYRDERLNVFLGDLGMFHVDYDSNSRLSGEQSKLGSLCDRCSC